MSKPSRVCELQHLIEITAIFPVFCLDKIPPKGSLIVECGKMLEENGYKVRCFNTVNFQKSMHYNPFKYIRSEKDIIQENFVYHHAK